MILSTSNYGLLGYKQDVCYVEFNGNIFVNRSYTIKDAIRKIKRNTKEFETKQAVDQMRKANENIVFTDLDMVDKFPEYFV